MPEKCAEIVNEMSLVVIAAIERDVAPANRLSAGDFFQDGLEPAHAAKKFRRHADVLLEKFDEPARAEAGFVGDFAQFLAVAGCARKFATAYSTTG